MVANIHADYRFATMPNWICHDQKHQKGVLLEIYNHIGLRSNSMTDNEREKFIICLYAKIRSLRQKSVFPIYKEYVDLIDIDNLFMELLVEKNEEVTKQEGSPPANRKPHP